MMRIVIFVAGMIAAFTVFLPVAAQENFVCVDVSDESCIDLPADWEYWSDMYRDGDEDFLESLQEWISTREMEPLSRFSMVEFINAVFRKGALLAVAYDPGESDLVLVLIYITPLPVDFGVSSDFYYNTNGVEQGLKMDNPNLYPNALFTVYVNAPIEYWEENENRLRKIASSVSMAPAAVVGLNLAEIVNFNMGAAMGPVMLSDFTDSIRHHVSGGGYADIGNFSVSGCSGYVSYQPTISYQIFSVDESISMFLVAESDSQEGVVLFIFLDGNDPIFWCNSTIEGSVAVSMDDLMPGQYKIWLGTLMPGEIVEADLLVQFES